MSEDDFEEKGIWRGINPQGVNIECRRADTCREACMQAIPYDNEDPEIHIVHHCRIAFFASLGITHSVSPLAPRIPFGEPMLPFDEPQVVIRDMMCSTASAIRDAVVRARVKHPRFIKGISQSPIEILVEEIGEICEARQSFDTVHEREEIMDAIAVLVRMYEGDL